MRKLGRREFLEAAVTTAGVSSAGAVIFKRWHPATLTGISEIGDANATFSLVRSMTPTSQVSLGKSGLRVSMVGIGTGSIGWGHRSNQTQLGQSEFTRLMRHAIDTLFRPRLTIAIREARAKISIAFCVSCAPTTSIH